MYYLLLYGGSNEAYCFTKELSIMNKSSNTYGVVSFCCNIGNFCFAYPERGGLSLKQLKASPYLIQFCADKEQAEETARRFTIYLNSF